MIPASMQLHRLTSRAAVERALDEYDELGQTAFLAKYGFGPAYRYFVLRDGRRYDSKAIVGAAWGYQFPEEGPASPHDFVGGASTVAPTLSRLGFAVVTAAEERSALTPGTVYTWAQLADSFEFRPAYLSVAGGMIPRPDHDAILVITHPGGAKSFDYHDYWDGADLIYTGRGQNGNQQLDGANRDVADNRRTILVFEYAGPERLQFKGAGHCVDWWPDTGLDRNKRPRRIYRFRLKFGDVGQAAIQANGTELERAAPLRRPRPFDPDRPPSAYRKYARRADPEQTRALQEKATLTHHDLLMQLARSLNANNWQDVEEIAAAVDLWGRPRTTSPRVIFEAKTVSARSAAGRLRAALGQLLEYRFFFGDPRDELCVVTSSAVNDERIRFLRAVGVDVIWFEGGAPVTRGLSVNRGVATLVGAS
jgi:hypothetical protein